jgi:hypothetical protein
MVQLVKGKVSVGGKKGIRLRPSSNIDGGVDAASLHYPLQIIVCLSVTDQVNFFSVQVSLILSSTQINFI